MNEVRETKRTAFGLKVIFADGTYKYVDAWLPSSSDEGPVAIEDEASIQVVEGS